VRAIDVATYFLSKDDKRELFNKKLIHRNGRDFYEGNARLNKYLHIAQNLYIAKTGSVLFPDEMYAYDNGAVVASVQENYAVLYGRHTVPALPADISTFLDKVFAFLKNASLDELIDLSHEDTEWEEKHIYYAKKDQRMDPMRHVEEYKEQYSDALRVMEDIPT
jgi:uncharacterized phage-associated protein